MKRQEGKTKRRNHETSTRKATEASRENKRKPRSVPNDKEASTNSNGSREQQHRSHCRLAEVANVPSQPKRRLAVGNCDRHEWGTEVHGEGRDFARSSTMHQSRTSRPNCESSKERSNQPQEAPQETEERRTSSSAEAQRVGKTR